VLLMQFGLHVEPSRKSGTFLEHSAHFATWIGVYPY
jgi:hypothetical protein